MASRPRRPGRNEPREPLIRPTHVHLNPVNFSGRKSTNNTNLRTKVNKKTLGGCRLCAERDANKKPKIKPENIFDGKLGATYKKRKKKL